MSTLNLAEMGFKFVTNFREYVASKELEIKPGIPYTWDVNNGVTAVYDERGDVWVKLAATRADHDAIHEIGYRRGAHVPMSNDGGQMIRRLFGHQEARV